MTKISDWYYVDKETLGRYDVASVKSSLIERGKEFDLSYSKEGQMILYRDIGDYLLVPRYYGLDTFGEPDETDFAKSWNINVEFNGELDEEGKNQVSLVTQFLEKSEESVGGILCSGPGTGKTVMGLNILSHFKTHTLVLVHKEFIMQQWLDRINQFLKGEFTTGIIQQGKCEYQEDIVIGMLQSFNSREYPEKMYKSFGLVICDETHHMSAPTFFSTATRFNPDFIMGLTATPYRGDGLQGIFFKHIGPILAQNRSMDVGGLVYQIGVDADLEDKMFRMRNGKFNLARWVSRIARLDERTKIVAKHAIKLKNTGRKVMILSHRLKHVDNIISEVELLDECAGKCVGGMSAKQVFNTFSEYDIIVGTYQFISEAVDIPELNGLVLATPHSNIEQAVGRLTRTTVKKKKPIVTEIVDVWSERAKKYAKRHESIYKRLGFEMKT